MDIIDDSNQAELPLKEDVKLKLQLDDAGTNEVKTIFKRVLINLKTNGKADSLLWLNDDWINATVNSAPNKFDRALDRWRKLYKSAQRLLSEAIQIIEGGLYTRDSEQMKEALRNQAQGIRQRDLLCNRAVSSGNSRSEFYPYRYLASEGFLPGYNFTRLPVRTYIPIGDSGEYISRPRFIALREFGPGNIIYHNGGKYMVEQMLASELDKNLQKAKVCLNCGYLFTGVEFEMNPCTLCGSSLSDGNSKEVFVHLLEAFGNEDKRHRADHLRGGGTAIPRVRNKDTL